jgi:uncharacterized protein involved in propanediol utilization
MCIAHHGEILQGLFQSGSGQYRRALVTLPWPTRVAVATFQLIPAAVNQAQQDTRPKEKALRAVRLALAHLGQSQTGGILELSSTIPIGRGLGSSTSDVVAAIRAVVNAYQASLTDAQIARLAVAAEVASDSTMFDNAAVLFAHRDGDVLETFSRRLPPLEVLGFDTCEQEVGIDTILTAPPVYSTEERTQFRELKDCLRQGIENMDPGAVGAVASASAEINQKYLPKPKFSELQEIALAAGAVGLQVAHSGTVAGLLFDRQNRSRQPGLARAKSSLIRLGFASCYRFTTQ